MSMQSLFPCIQLAWMHETIMQYLFYYYVLLLVNCVFNVMHTWLFLDCTESHCSDCQSLWRGAYKAILCFGHFLHSGVITTIYFLIATSILVCFCPVDTFSSCLFHVTRQYILICSYHLCSFYIYSMSLLLVGIRTCVCGCSVHSFQVGLCSRCIYAMNNVSTWIIEWVPVIVGRCPANAWHRH